MDQKVTNVKIAALMTAGRYENTFARNMIDQSLKKAGIPLIVSGGVFYGQCMQKMMVDAVNSETDIVLTVDGDSLFSAEHIKRLLGVLVANPDIDCLASLQCRRGTPFPLLTIGTANKMESDGSPVKVTTAHFGLTAIRVDRLKTVQKPWFASQPNENGDWETNKLDDDIWFWHQWRKAGLNIYVDPGCSIGHLEEMAVVFDSEGIAKHQYPQDWRAANGM